jgi:signal transduction histidine kinase
VSIEELITILIDNALKYSPAASKIRVNLRRSGKKARFEVINTGRGIKPEDLPHIFDRFYRADESRTSGKKTGFGLGLSLAKKIVELHKGDFSVSSQPGKETIFVVSLPLYEKKTRRKRGPAK